MQNGKMRNANNIHEWLQQMTIEQCALITDLNHQLPGWDLRAACGCRQGENEITLPLQLSRADGFEVPGDYCYTQTLTGRHCCSDAEGMSLGTDAYCSFFQRLLRKRQLAEMHVRAARKLLPKLRNGYEVFNLLEPLLEPSSLSSFPCDSDAISIRSSSEM